MAKFAPAAPMAQGARQGGVQTAVPATGAQVAPANLAAAASPSRAGGASLAPIIQAAGPNYKTNSQLFQGMNQKVTTADLNFHALPPTAPPTFDSQQAWVNASFNIATTKVCGCNHEQMGGQVLHRLVYYITSVFNLPMVTYPPVTPGQPTGTVIDIHNFPFSPPSARRITMTFSNPGLEFYFIIQLGMGLGNPQFHHQAGANTIVVLPGQQYFELLWAIQPGESRGVCNWGWDFVPHDPTTVPWS